MGRRQVRRSASVMTKWAGATVIRAIGVQRRVSRDREERDQRQREAQPLQDAAHRRCRKPRLGPGAIIRQKEGVHHVDMLRAESPASSGIRSNSV